MNFFQGSQHGRIDHLVTYQVEGDLHQYGFTLVSAEQKSKWRWKFESISAMALPSASRLLDNHRVRSGENPSPPHEDRRASEIRS